MSHEKRVIFNADDFGLSPEVNRAIIAGHREGLLTSTSLMVAEPAAEEAVALARGCPDLELGLHLVLCRANPVWHGFRLFFSPWARAEIRREVRAQIERFRALVGRVPAHLNGHLNIHVHPAVLPVAVEAARDAGIPAIRLPLEPGAWIFEVLSRRAERALDAAGIRHVRRCYGIRLPFGMTEAVVADLIERLEPGLTEIYFHPGHPLQPVAPDPELAALRSERLRRRLAELGVARVGHDLAVRPEPVAAAAPDDRSPEKPA